MLGLLGLATVGRGQPPQEPIRFLVPPISQPNQVYSRFQPLAEHLQAETEALVRLRVAGNLESFFRLAAEKRPQIIYLCPLSYVHLADHREIHPLARLRRNGKATFRAAILVRKDSRFQSLAELQGARFAYGNAACATSKLVPDAMLQRAGVDPSRDFLEKRALGSNRNALYTVAADLFDATAVGEHTARPFLARDILRVLAYSRPIPQYVIAANGLVPSEQRARLTATLTSLRRPDQQRVLESLATQVNGFIAASDSDYDVLREMEDQRAANGQPPLPLPSPVANGDR